jgi:thiaminase
LDIGNSEDWFALHVAMAPCLIGYGVIAKRLYDDPKTKRKDNIYWKWIETYVADDYSEAVASGSGKSDVRERGTKTHPNHLEALLERNAVLQSPHRIEELARIFIHATKVYDMSKDAIQNLLNSF